MLKLTSAFLFTLIGSLTLTAQVHAADALLLKRLYDGAGNIDNPEKSTLTLKGRNALAKKLIDLSESQDKRSEAAAKDNSEPSSEVEKPKSKEELTIDSVTDSGSFFEKLETNTYILEQIKTLKECNKTTLLVAFNIDPTSNKNEEAEFYVVGLIEPIASRGTLLGKFPIKDETTTIDSTTKYVTEHCPAKILGLDAYSLNSKSKALPSMKSKEISPVDEAI